MGNHHSTSSASHTGGSGSRTVGSTTSSLGGGGHHHLPSFRRTGTLGLSKAELEQRCKPSGLYPSCKWDERGIRRLIGDGKLAARLGGSDVRSNPTDQECPICFLHYSEINITNCCSATVCTECYLQIRPQKERAVTCPFCNNPKITVVVAKTMDSEDIQKRDHEEQAVIEAKIRARANTGESATGTVDSASTDGNNNNNNEGGGTGGDSPSSPSRDGFGSSLERHSSILRTRSESISSADSGYDSSSLALTSDDRRRLEEEMRAQLSHPLSRRMEAEAEERRFENEREYYRSNSHRLRSRRAAEALLLRSHDGGIGLGGGGRRDRFARMTSDSRLLTNPSRTAGGRDWNQIVDAFERGGNGGVQSIDDLVVIEAAILLSMEEEAVRRRAAQRNQTSDGDNDQSDGTTEGNDGGSENNAADDDFDAAEQARAGFPMLRSRLVRSRLSGGGDDDDDENENDGDSVGELRQRGRGFNDRPSLGSRGHLLTSLQRPSSTHVATAGMLMRGISEEEQIAMALALSLRDAEAAQMRENNNDSNEDNSDANNDGTSANGEENRDTAVGDSAVQTQEGNQGATDNSPSENDSNTRDNENSG